MNTKRKFNVCLPVSHETIVKELAKKRHTTVAALAREAVDSYLRKMARGNPVIAAIVNEIDVDSRYVGDPDTDWKDQPLFAKDQDNA